MAMSRSVIMPTRRSFSCTGIAPASISSMTFATSRMLWPGLAKRTSRLIASLTRIEPSLVVGATRITKQEIERGGEGSDGQCHAASDRDRGRQDDEKRALRRERLGGNDPQGQQRRDQRPPLQVGDEHPAHRPV